ncbi:MAG: hypothetical protein AAF544_08585, partial [Bacteroidota bacterium]
LEGLGAPSDHIHRNGYFWEHIDVAGARVNEAVRRGMASKVAEILMKYLFPDYMQGSDVARMATLVLALMPKFALHIETMKAIEVAVLARVEQEGGASYYIPPGWK